MTRQLTTRRSQSGASPTWITPAFRMSAKTPSVTKGTGAIITNTAGPSAIAADLRTRYTHSGQRAMAT
eukprot:CAMPEP_0174738492 /NCGR_PEP_ID=MMETSP1094-20130205/70028_1 /TAXON_ID=156173 /ORGANISM="Chrysochromulina brevifilum, Strain UTEX LB 985" /LENGTH=67 /DNA_ID=CAMNT_0015941915 /DNA_START=533 /DNA_END=732 /DNA_ORIENTATION=+